MIIKDATLTALKTEFSKLFQKGLKEAPQDWKKIATRVQSGSATNTYGWLGKFPKLREWIGDRALKNMKEHSYAIPNKKFESTVEVDRSDIEDDAYGIYAPMMEEAGQAVHEHVDENVFSLLSAGFSNTCYDGQNFFDTDHPVNSEVDGTGSDVSVSNIVNPEVTDKPAWFILCTKRPLKPTIFQERTAPEFQAITDPKQDTVFMKDSYLYGVRTRRAFGYGFWQMAVACRDELTEANLNKAIQMMQEFEADGSKKLNMQPDLLVVPPSLRAAAKSLVEAQLLSNGGSNVNFKVVDLLVTPWVA